MTALFATVKFFLPATSSISYKSPSMRIWHYQTAKPTSNTSFLGLLHRFYHSFGDIVFWTIDTETDSPASFDASLSLLIPRPRSWRVLARVVPDFIALIELSCISCFFFNLTYPDDDQSEVRLSIWASNKSSSPRGSFHAIALATLMNK